MAAKERLINLPIDRTPYAGCAWVAAIAGLVFILGASLLWNLGGRFKRYRIDSWHAELPSLRPAQGPDLRSQVEEAATQSTERARQALEERLNKEKEAAKAAAEAEAKRQLEEGADALQQSATDGLKNYLAP